MSRHVIGFAAISLFVGIVIGRLLHLPESPRTAAETPEGAAWIIRTDPGMTAIASHSGGESADWSDKQYIFTFRDHEDAFRARVAIRDALGVEYRRTLAKQ